MELESYTLEEIAKKFGWSPRHVRKLAREIRACRLLGNRMVLLKEDVIMLLEAAKPVPTVKHHALPRGTYADLVARRGRKPVASKS